MNAPEILIIIWYIISLLVFAHLHGKDKNGKYNFWHGFLNVIIIMSLLLWAGLFH